MKNRIVSLFLAATMVLSLCPVSIRAEAASADTVQVQEIPETESKQSSPVDEEPVITGTGSEGEQPPEAPVIIGTGEEQGAASEDVKQEDIKAKFENGILSLSVPKPVEQKKVETSKHIAIEG